MEETVRTRVLKTTRVHLKEIAAYAIAVASSVVAFSVAYGHKQADNEQLSSDVATLKSDMQGIKASVANTNIQLATIQGTLNGISMKADNFSKFKEDVQNGAKEALAMPIKQGHRAKK